MVTRKKQPVKKAKSTSTRPKTAKKGHTEIFLDTNFLMIPAQAGVDIYTEIDRICKFKYDLFVLRHSLDELDKLQKTGKGRDKAAAKLASHLVKAKNINVLSTACNHVDDALIKIAKHDGIVATQDKNLKKRLKKEGIKIITLRQKKHVTII